MIGEMLILGRWRSGQTASRLLFLFIAARVVGWGFGRQDGGEKGAGAGVVVA